MSFGNDMTVARNEKLFSNYQPSNWLIQLLLPLTLVLSSIYTAQASDNNEQYESPNHAIVDRIDQLVASFNQAGHFIVPPDIEGSNAMQFANQLQIQHCDTYPYHKQQDARTGYITLIQDIQAGLEQGLQCMAGVSDQGYLHSYHEQQAKMLMDIIESKQRKTFRCVQDQMHAFAVANTFPKKVDPSGLDRAIQGIPYPAVVMDTYRLSGFISDQHPPEVYRDFFKMNEEQIARQQAGEPQRLAGLHRYKDRAGLVFHEMLHWLGHEHTNLDPDPVFLYETCCFGGSDFIEDKTSNARFQLRACSILRDKELWEANQYKQMRIWKFKQYNELKRDMRDQYN